MVDSIIPTNTPFNYDLGINYETWGRADITTDLNVITEYFSLIRTYHDAAVGTADPTSPIIDPTEYQVIHYLTSTPAANNVQLVMGTNNNDLAQGGYGAPWSPGLMTSSAYTDAWVQMIIGAFGNVANTLQHLKTIQLGNEIDANGPPASDPVDFAKYQTWIDESFSNLQASLAKYGLGSVPVSTTIANYSSQQSANPIAYDTVNYIQNHWSSSWNGGSPFVFFNQYTQNDQSSTDFSNYVVNYFNSLTKIGATSTSPGILEPFVGETGETSYNSPPSYNGSQTQLAVYQQINSWLNSQQASPDSNGKTIPVFLFDAFNVPSNPDPVQVNDGIFVDNSSGVPTGALKPGVIITSWSNTAIGGLGASIAHHYVATTDDGSSEVGVGHVVTITLNTVAAETVTGTPTLQLSDNEVATYVNGSGTNALQFSYTVQAGDSASDLQVTGLNLPSGATIQDAQGNNLPSDVTGDLALEIITLVTNLQSSADHLVYLMFQASFARMPDYAGFEFWAGYADHYNPTALQLADIFMAAPEFTAKFGANPSNSAYVTELYTNVLGRAPDPAGLAYWVAQANGGQAHDQLLVDFATCAENIRTTGPHTAQGYWVT